MKHILNVFIRFLFILSFGLSLTACNKPSSYTPKPYIPIEPQFTEQSTTETHELNQEVVLEPYIPASQYHTIALLLPISGKLAANGTSIRDGFFTAYNASQSHGTAPVNIKVYDTKDEQNVDEIYKQAVKDDAELVIGPLTKSGVEQLNRLKRLSVPVIALNTVAEKNEHDDLFEFGLAPEDEARKAANYAFQQGKRRALLLVQADEWGGRVSSAFSEQWTLLNGSIVSKMVYDPNDKMDQVIRQALRIQMTEAQKEDNEYRPQYRQDVDMIFLAGYPHAARQIKPLLDFYYVHNIKLYGTSSLYALPPNPGLDKDLNQVAFCDMPWLIAPQKAQPQLRKTINELWPNTAQAYARFYALGIDAYLLSTQTHNLNNQRLYQLSGVTGTLNLSNNNRISRDVICTEFQHGKPISKL